MFENFMSFPDESERRLERGSPSSFEILKKVRKNIFFLDKDY